MKAKINDVEINLSSHELESIPNEIFGLENRIILNVSHNKIKAGVYKEEKEFEKGKIGIVNEPYDGITVGIKKLTKLEKLYLNDNEILEIPQYLTEITTLKTLDLSSNNIEKISDNLLKLTNLEELNLSNNPVSQIKGFALKKSPKDIIDFLLLNQEKERIPVNEVKLLVLGDENSGKSSLVERMIYDRFNPEYNSTNGIDINDELKLDNTDIKIKIWDFAGQEITYQIHNLFMSQESLYLLVIDGQKENDMYEHFNWLETINNNANKPPIIVVVTKYETNRTYKLDEYEYRKKFSNISKICYVSSKEGSRISELKELIGEEINKINNIYFPKEYKPIKDEIEKKDSDYILEPSEFKKICKKYGFELKEERANIRTILTDIGVIIGLDKDDRHYVNPNTIIDYMYKIIRSREIDDAGKIPIQDNDDSDHNWIIKFLIKNKIAFKIDDSNVMIPSRLPVNRPDDFSLKSYQGIKEDDKDFKEGLNYRYRYIHGFKRGILYDFILSIYDSIKEYNPTYWANGICWKQNGIKVAILLNRISKTIDIHIPINSRNSRVLLTDIRERFEKINKEDTTIFVIEEIAIFKDNEIKKYISYEFLKYKRDRRDKEVEIEIHQKPYIYNLLKLIDRYEYEEKLIEVDTNKPLIITEGKTDKQILETAWEKLYPEVFMPYTIQVSGVEIEEDKKQGNADLLKRVLELDKHENRIIIGIFDNDKEGNEQFKGLKKGVFEAYKIKNPIRKHLSRNIYGMLLPVPKFRENFITEDDILQRYFVIEHYFSDKVLEKYNMKGHSILGTEVFKVTNGKDIFSKKIKKLNKEEFKYFELLFDVIKKIIKDSK